MAEHFQRPVNKVNDLNFNALPKKHGGPHKMSSRATCDRSS